MRLYFRRPSQPELLWLAVLLWLGLSQVVITLLTPRVFQGDAAPAASGLADRLSRLLVWGTLLLAGGIIALCVPRLRLGGRALSLWLGALALSVGPLVSSRLGTAPGFSTALLLTPAVATALYLLPPVRPAWVVRWSKLLLLFYAYASLLAVALAPRWAVEWGYRGFVPGLALRLHGVAGHANLLGPMLLAYLILEWAYPGRTRLRWVHVGAVSLALLLVQSKTTWLIAGILFIVRLTFEASRLRGYGRPLAYLMLTAAATVGAALLFSAGQLEGRLQVSSSQLASLRTLTGRTQIWDVTLRLWQQNPLFGYGPGLWSGAMRQRYVAVMGWEVPHAHNQVLQSLGEAGIVGGLGLLVYLVVLLRRGMQHAGPTRGASFALVLMLVLRGATEVPLRSGAGIEANFLLAFLVYAVLMAMTQAWAPAAPPLEAPRRVARPAPLAVEAG